MLSFFRSRREGNTEVVSGEHDFFRRLERMGTPRELFEAQGAEHSEIDLRLVEKIEGLLVPLLGQWEQTDRWFHQMDFYGDGVRSIMFRRDVFPKELVFALQALLVGEHEPFAIVCTVVDQLLSSAAVPACARPDDFLAIFARKLLVTKHLANELSSDA